MADPPIEPSTERLAGLRLALTTFTVAPVRGPARVDRRTGRTAMELAPLVGLLVALVAGVVLYTFRVVADFRAMSLLPSVLAVATLALVTRGLHLDGLADLTDGLGSYRDPEGTRAVMKKPDVGPMGVAAVVLVLLTQVAALESCVIHGRGTGSLLLSVALGRLAATIACTGPAAATPDGLGALVAGTVRRWVAASWVVVLGAAFAWWATVDPDNYGPDREQVVRTLLGVVLGLGAARLLQWHAVRRVGGLTGDVLGALVEVATTVCLVVLASGQVGQ